MLIDTIYRTVQSIVNKENNGYVSPDEYNLFLNQVINEIFREYFDDENKNKNRQNRGLTNGGYSNLPDIDRQRIQHFAAYTGLTYSSGSFTLPTDLYLIEDDGIATSNGRVIEAMERSRVGYASRSIAAPSEVYPVYEKYDTYITVLPPTIVAGVTCRYLRKPLEPKWTYQTVSGSPLFNPSAPDFQDVDMHASEASNIVMRLLTLFGINLREDMVVQIAELLKDKQNIKETN